MNEVNVMTVGGPVKLAPGDKFQAYIAARGGSKSPHEYQYLGLLRPTKGYMLKRPIYLHDLTDDTYHEVSYGWFALKLIVKWEDVE